MILGLVVGLIAVAITMYGVVKERVHVRIESDNLSTMYTKAEEFNATNTVDLNNEKAINSGIIPEEMKINNNKINNVWNGAVTIESNKSFFKLTYAHVPTRDSCIELLDKQKNIGWDVVVVGEQTFENYKNITKIDVAKACDLRDKHVDIVFKKIKI